MNLGKINQLAKILWDYSLLHQEIKPADCILVLGSKDTRVAERAVELYQQKYAPYIIFSGGYGRVTKFTFDKSEAETFADIAISAGVPQDKVIIENKSTNTGENLQFTKKILEELNLDFQTFIIVQKPYMERRALAAFQKQWPEKEATVTSPNIKFEDYVNEKISFDYFVNALVADIQRIKIYGEKGYQIPQKIPGKVWQTYEELVKLGYDKHLIKE
ncbi:MAG: YdcF family protein [Patescibacteria group bacterium]|jgi:uncharacterized SAM-binding protein YcdF (DUF218 family)